MRLLKGAEEVAETLTNLQLVDKYQNVNMSVVGGVDESISGRAKTSQLSSQFRTTILPHR